MTSELALSPDTIYVFAQKAWWFLIVLGVLVAFHEFGHYLAARWVGVKVLKFSLGFGPKLFGQTVGETEYIVSAIPLGGYVKLFGEDAAEPIPVKEQSRSFSFQSIPKKMLIVGAGPSFNFLLSYLIFTLWLASGSHLFVPTIEDLTPIVKAIAPNSPAELAGFQIGDRILRVNDQDISTQSELYHAVNESHGRQLTIDILRDGHGKTLLVTPIPHNVETHQENPTYSIGVEELSPEVGGVLPNTPAAQAGLMEGDRIIRLDGQPIQTWAQMTEIVRKSPGRALHLTIERQHEILTLTITPSPEEFIEDGQSKTIGKIGIMSPGRSVMRAQSLLSAPFVGLQTTWSWCELTVVGVYKILTGEISSKNIGGPIMIASASGEAAEHGISNLIFLIAILSINLGILNLLPIPILDGGHLFLFAWEAILGRPLGERPREIAQQVGFVVLLCIMFYAFWNDIARLLQ